jgi:hypothetical protein
MEPNSPKKIQFAVPLFQSQIAPEAAEQVSRIGRGAIPVCKVIQMCILSNQNVLYLFNLTNFVTFKICGGLSWFMYALVFGLQWRTIG